MTWLWCVQMQQNEMVGKVMDELKRKGMFSGLRGKGKKKGVDSEG